MFIQICRYLERKHCDVFSRCQMNMYSVYRYHYNDFSYAVWQIHIFFLNSTGPILSDSGCDALWYVLGRPINVHPRTVDALVDLHFWAQPLNILSDFDGFARSFFYANEYRILTTTSWFKVGYQWVTDHACLLVRIKTPPKTLPKAFKSYKLGHRSTA